MHITISINHLWTSLIKNAIYTNSSPCQMKKKQEITTNLDLKATPALRICQQSSSITSQATLYCHIAIVGPAFGKLDVYLQKLVSEMHSIHVYPTLSFKQIHNIWQLFPSPPVSNLWTLHIKKKIWTVKPPKLHSMKPRVYLWAESVPPPNGSKRIIFSNLWVSKCEFQGG